MKKKILFFPLVIDSSFELVFVLVARDYLGVCKASVVFVTVILLLVVALNLENTCLKKLNGKDFIVVCMTDI